MQSPAPLRIALVGPTRSRPELFAQAVAAVRPQVDFVLTVVHGGRARVYAEPLVDALVEWPEPLPNISAMWTLGLDLARDIAAAPFDLAILNDDAIVEPGWFDRLAGAMHAAGAAGASGSRRPNKPATIAGYAFLLDGTRGVRPDERMRWWYSDDALQRRCEAAGGWVSVYGVGAVNVGADTATRSNELLRSWSRDDERAFLAVYGARVRPGNTHRGTGRTPLVISAPSGDTPTALLAAAGNRPILLLDTPVWEDEHLRIAAAAFDWFVFVKESTRILDPAAFWAAVDVRTEPGWLFAPPSCFMAVYARQPLQDALRDVAVTDKWGSIRLEAQLARRLGMRDAIWPDVADGNPLRVDGRELVIGNRIIEKSKGSAWCGRCDWQPPGLCAHVGAA